MIKANLFKMEQSGFQCFNPKCSHNEKYHNNILGQVFHIKIGTTCLLMTIDNSYEIYCRECIDNLYIELKPVLDSKLWPIT